MQRGRGRRIWRDKSGSSGHDSELHSDRRVVYTRESTTVVITRSKRTFAQVVSQIVTITERVLGGTPIIIGTKTASGKRRRSLPPQKQRRKYWHLVLTVLWNFARLQPIRLTVQPPLRVNRKIRSGLVSRVDERLMLPKLQPDRKHWSCTTRKRKG